jgi:CRISPR-associated protein Csh2
LNSKSITKIIIFPLGATTGSYSKAKRAEILFYYDARLCNPNGDPDENRPCKDGLTERLFVTEFRIKRTIRDYLKKVLGKQIFMRQELRSTA